MNAWRSDSLSLLHLTVLLLLLPWQTARAFEVTTTRTTTRTTTTTCVALKAVSRRHVLSTSAAALASSASISASPLSAAAAAEGDANLVADLQMTRLKLPKDGFGREYLAIPLTVQGQGPFEFMVDTGLTTELITPHLQSLLGMDDNGRSSSGRGRGRGLQQIQGLSAGGTSLNTLIELKDVQLPTGQALPVLHAIVTDFPQEHIDPAHDPIEGMIGMEALSLFDVDFDFPNNRLRLYKPGTAPTTGLIEIPAAVINETGLIGIRIRSASAANEKQQQQPILGFLDCGAAFSVVNSVAAPLLGLPSDPKNVSNKGPTVAAIGIDGRPFPMPTIPTTLTFAGNVQIDTTTDKPIGFAPPPAIWRPWNPIYLGIGDIPAFSTVLGDGQTPYQGPAALIGLDVLAQRRIILATVPETNRSRSGSRQRSVWVAAN
jgi:hypothetical protein